MNPETLDLFINIAKILKCDIVMNKGGIIYGTDKDFAHLSKIEHHESKLWELDNVVFESNSFTIAIDQEQRLRDFENLINTTYSIQFSDVSESFTDLQDNEQFKIIMAKKAAEGISLLKLNDYLLSINKSLIPVNKADKLDLDIFDLGKTFLARFKIKKGKNYVHKYFMYIKI